jgi:hypothetical protein
VDLHRFLKSTEFSINTHGLPNLMSPTHAVVLVQSSETVHRSNVREKRGPEPTAGAGWSATIP